MDSFRKIEHLSRIVSLKYCNSHTWFYFHSYSLSNKQNLASQNKVKPHRIYCSQKLNSDSYKHDNLILVDKAISDLLYLCYISASNTVVIPVDLTSEKQSDVTSALLENSLPNSTKRYGTSELNQFWIVLKRTLLFSRRDWVILLLLHIQEPHLLFLYNMICPNIP